jgi:hypothetical protein
VKDRGTVRFEDIGCRTAHERHAAVADDFTSVSGESTWTVRFQRDDWDVRVGTHIEEVDQQELAGRQGRGPGGGRTEESEGDLAEIATERDPHVGEPDGGRVVGAVAGHRDCAAQALEGLYYAHLVMCAGASSSGNCITGRRSSWSARSGCTCSGFSFTGAFRRPREIN